MVRLSRSPERGQVLVLFAAVLVGLILATGLVIDAGYAYSQSRVAQNAADFAAMAGTRIVGERLTGHPVGAGTATNVQSAITSALAANNATLDSAQYVDNRGVALGNVFSGNIPSNAFGVVVRARSTWRPFFLGVIGLNSLSAGQAATALTPGSRLGGGVLPVGIQNSMYQTIPECPIDDLTACIYRLTPGVHNIPGGFGWLSFGLHGNGNKCDWTSSLGMVADGGCQMSQPYLQSQIDGPDSHGCCTEVGLPGSVDLISTLTGNEWGDLSFYIQNQIPIWAPIWDYAGGSGSNAYYHIVGFGALVFTGQGTQHAKWLTGTRIALTSCDGPGNDFVPGTSYCKAPGGAFTVGVTGAVHLVR